VASLAACQLTRWEGKAWRGHNRRYGATDLGPTGPGGLPRFSGRYNQGLDQFPPHQSWAALYLGLSQDITLHELWRQVVPTSYAGLGVYRISELWVEARAVLDCRDTACLGLAPQLLHDDKDYTVPRAIAAAAVARGAEGILLPSATRLGDILVFFPRNCLSGTRLWALKSVDARIFVGRA
jgi:hypothetical protein